MKIAVLSQTGTNIYTLTRLREEASKIGIELEHLKYSDLTFNFGDELRVDCGLKDFLNDFDAYIFRNATSDRTKYGHMTKILMTLLKQRTTKIINLNKILLHSSISTKFYAHALMATNNIPTIPTKIFASNEQALKVSSQMVYPLIAKLSVGSHGDGVALIKSVAEFEEYVNTSPKISDVLFQKYITNPASKTNEDIRVLTLGKRILGAYKRMADKEQVITNMSSGAKGEVFELSQDVINIVEKLIDIYKADFVGIDIIFDEGRPLVLEVNGAPQFEGFEKTTGINVAFELLKYIKEVMP